MKEFAIDDSIEIKSLHYFKPIIILNSTIVDLNCFETIKS